METPSAEVMKQIEQVKTKFYEINRTEQEKDGGLIGFLWRHSSSGWADVMYVTQGYYDRKGGNPTIEWEAYNYYPLDAMEHSTEW